MAQTNRQRQMRWSIVSDILPKVMLRFLEKNQDYGDGNDEFGAKGEVIEIGRKYKKIKACIWDGQQLRGEPLEEVIDDMIGHLLLLREALSTEGAGRAVEFTHFEWYRIYMAAIQSYRTYQDG